MNRRKPAACTTQKVGVPLSSVGAKENSPRRKPSGSVGSGVKPRNGAEEALANGLPPRSGAGRKQPDATPLAPWAVVFRPTGWPPPPCAPIRSDTRRFPRNTRRQHSHVAHPNPPHPPPQLRRPILASDRHERWQSIERAGWAGSATDGQDRRMRSSLGSRRIALSERARIAEPRRRAGCGSRSTTSGTATPTTRISSTTIISACSGCEW